MAASTQLATTPLPTSRDITTTQHADRVDRLYSAWHARAGIATYAALRDESLALCEQTDAWVSALHFVARLAYPEQLHSDETWKDFTAVVKTAESRRESARRISKQASNESNRQRNITLLCALWSPQVVTYYSWDSASQSQLNALRACAERYPRFKDQFRPRLNYVLLERHCLALLSSHTKTLNEAALQPHRDLDQVLNKDTPLRRSIERSWTRNRNGNIAIDVKGTTLVSVRPQHYRMYLLRLDAHGVLCPRFDDATVDGAEPWTTNVVGLVTARDEDRLIVAEEDDEEEGEDAGAPAEVAEADPELREDRSTFDVALGNNGPSQDRPGSNNFDVSADAELIDCIEGEDCDTRNAMEVDPDAQCQRGNNAEDDATQDVPLEPIRSPHNDTVEIEKWNEFLWSDSPTLVGNGNGNPPTDDVATFEIEWDFHRPYLESFTAFEPGMGDTGSDLPHGEDPLPSSPELREMLESIRQGPNALRLHQESPGIDIVAAGSSSMLVHGPIASMHMGWPSTVQQEQIGSFQLVAASSDHDAAENIETILQHRYGAMISEYVHKIATEAQEGEAGTQKAARAQWLKPDMTMAKIYTTAGSDLPSGTARSAEDADIFYSTAVEHLEQARGGAIFAKPIVLKESFTDSGMHKFADVVDQVQDTYDGLMLHLRWLDEDRSVALSCGKVVEYLRNDAFGRPARGMNLRSLRKCHRPTFTLLQRFRLLETLMARVRDFYPCEADDVSSLDTDRSQSFSTVSARGAFSGPRITTASGSWIRILDGVSLYAIAPLPVSDMGPGMTPSRASNHTLKLLILEQDDVLVLPPGLSVVFAIHSPTNGVAEGGFFWDELSILKTLDQALSNPLQTATGMQNLRRLVDQLADLLRSQSGRFCINGDDAAFMADFEAVRAHFHPSGQAS